MNEPQPAFFQCNIIEKKLSEGIILREPFVPVIRPPVYVLVMHCEVWVREKPPTLTARAREEGL